MIHYLCYISHEAIPFSNEMLVDLLKNSRSTNIKHEITGLLIYAQGTFIQYIEGPEKSIHQLYANIQSDPRHKFVVKLTDGMQPERSFPSWRMHFKYLNRDESMELFGFEPDHQEISDWLTQTDTGKGLKLIHTIASELQKS